MIKLAYRFRIIAEISNVTKNRHNRILLVLNIGVVEWWSIGVLVNPIPNTPLLHHSNFLFSPVSFA
jgi:hypothetical protein